MENKSRSDSLHSKERAESNRVWKQIMKFILEICQQNKDEINVIYDEEEERQIPKSKFANERSPSQSPKYKDFFIVKSSLRENFAELALHLGFNLNEQILKSFTHENTEQGNVENGKTEEGQRKEQLYQQMVQLGSNVASIYFSNDSRFVLKGIPESQFLTFQRNLQDQCLKNIYKKKNLLSLRILGLFEIHSDEVWDVKLELPSNHFILMENTLADWDFEKNLINSIYDLKGSSVGRSYEHSHSSSSDSSDDDKKKKKQVGLNSPNVSSTNSATTKFGKDNNFKTNQSDKDIITSLPESLRVEIIEQLKEECKLYSEANIMDYSLMVVIGEKIQKGQEGQNQVKDKNENKFRNIQTSNHVISFGLIDYLTQYDFKKNLENTFKSFFCSNSDEISCVEPSAYYDRLIKYAKKEVFCLKNN